MQTNAGASTQKIVASDLEGTLSAGEMWRDIGAYLKTHGFAAPYQRMFLGRVPAYLAAKLKLIDSQGFKNDWFVRVSRLFNGWTEAQMRDMAEVIGENLWRQRRQSVVDELVAHARAGARVYIVSGGLAPIVSAFASRLRAAGITDAAYFATPMTFVNGRYTGALSGPVCTGTVKTGHLRAFADAGALTHAYGDTYSDIPMLQLAQTGVAVMPDARLAAEAARNGWRVI
jgi:HAD superfamily phosphoserine phosphatase-like hydrolase